MMSTRRPTQSSPTSRRAGALVTFLGSGPGAGFESLAASVSFAAFVSFVSFVSLSGVAEAQDEVVRLLSDYVAIDTSNPPGDTRKAADFLAGVLEREGIPVTRYESAPGKAIIYARLKATVSPPAGKAILLMHHMDVVPADRSQWKTNPFEPTIRGNELWPEARWT